MKPIVAISLFSLMLGVGCSDSGKLLRESGLSAYEGNSVELRPTLVERAFGGDEANRIDVVRARQCKDVYERIGVYVDPSTVEDMSKNNVVYNSAELTLLLTRATEDSATQFGRFERTTSRQSARLIIASRLSSVNAWADTMVSQNDANAALGTSGRSVVGSVLHRVNREGVDVFVTVTFSRPDGTVIATNRALGRLVATQGNAIQSGDFALRNGESGAAKAVLEVTNAKINPTQLPQVLTVAVEGAIVQAINGSLGQLWNPPEGKNARPVNWAMVSPTDPSSASAQ